MPKDSEPSVIFSPYTTIYISNTNFSSYYLLCNLSLSLLYWKYSFCLEMYVPRHLGPHDILFFGIAQIIEMQTLQQLRLPVLRTMLTQGRCSINSEEGRKSITGVTPGVSLLIFLGKKHVLLLGSFGICLQSNKARPSFKNRSVISTQIRTCV